MGNQLTATAAVDLANVSGDLELVAPLGAEGRNYFASFHCLHYTSVVPGAPPQDASRGGSQPDAAGSPTLRHSAAFPVSGSTLTMPNAPCYTSGFMTAATRGGAAAGGAYAMGDHLQRTTPLLQVTSGASVEFHSTGPSSPASALPTAATATATTTTTAVTAAGAAGGQTWVVAAPGAAPLGGRGRGRGRGRGGGGGAERALTFAALCDGVAAIAAAASTTQVSAAERAAWHQARWQQRLPVADRPWRVVPSSLRLEAAYARPSSADAVMESWCRDCSGSAGGGNGGARSSGLRSNVRGFTPDSGASRLSSPALPAGPYASAYATAASATGSIRPAGAARNAASLDAVVAGLSGEWRSNYGNYVQLLLRSGAGAGLSSSSSAAAAAAPGGLVVSAPHGSLFPASASSAGVSSFLTASTGAAAAAAALAHYLVEDVVTKVFVRTPEDPGQAYFLRYVRHMMDNAGEQLRVVDSTLPRTTPRNCLWYTHVYEGEGFCVLQRPYVAFTLRERLAARPGWTAGERLFVVYQLLEAVAHLHETYGITHGDVKPNNVLVQSTGVVTLCDMAPFKPRRMPLDNPLLFDYYYDTDENRACYVAPEKFSDQPLPTPPLESRTRGSATYNVSNVNFDGHTASMDVFSTACVVLYVYSEEDPLTLAQVLALRHLSSSDARERAVRPVLRDAGVPLPLQPLLLSMLCAAADERPSAREVLRRGLAGRVFPAFFPYLYESVWPDLLTTTADARLLRLHGGLEGLLRHCDALTAAALMEVGDLSSSGRRDWEAGVAVPPSVASGASATRALAVSLLLPTLLQTLHASQTSDEATYRGLLCLRHCAAHCDFACLVDAVLPHVLFYVNNDAHMYGPATRLVALRLLCRIAEAIARHLTQRAPHTPAAPVSEEQWALLEHLVLPCVYDVLRQGEQESTAVLVEVATCLPRLLLFTRCVTERRQVLYGAEAGSGVATSAGGARPTTAPASRPPSRHRCTQSEEAIPPAAHRTFSAAAPPRRSSELQQLSSVAHGERHEGEGDFGERSGGSRDGNLHRRTMSSPARTSTNASPPPQPTTASALVTRSKNGSVSGDAPAGSALERGGSDAGRDDSVSGESAGTVDTPASSDDAGDDGLGPRTGTRPHRHGGIDFGAAGASEVRRSNASGTQQYLVQLRCLLSNGWGMLQTLYNHPCVPVAVAVMQQSASTVAAFLGEERVMADLIPLLTTALVAPLRVQRVLYPQAILLHALLQPSPQRQPPSKTLRLFVEEGLRHTDDACLKATLDSLAVVLRCRRLPPAEAMTLVHQTLPLLVESRLWLREAACGVVEAAAQTYTASDVAQHLEYAVRPLLLLPVPLAQLRRYAATAIRAELATTTTSGADCSVRGTGLAALEEPRHLIAGSSPLFSEDGVDGCDGAPIVLSPLPAQTQMAPPQQHQQQWPSLTPERHPAVRDHAATYTEVLPAVVAVTRSYAAGPAPTFLHGLPASELGSGGGGSRTLRMTRVAASWPDTAEEGAAGCVDEPPQGARAEGNLAYRLSAREAARVQRERQTCSVPVAATTGSAPAIVVASGRLEPAPAPLPGPSTSAAAAAAGALHRRPLSPPHSTDVAPVPVTLPPPSHVSRPSLRLSSSATAQHNGSYATAVRGTPPSAGPAVSALMGSQPAGSAPTALHLTMANTNATPLRPVAAALSTASAHTGAVYATAPSPGPSGVVVSAGARGEAFVWQVTSTHTGAAHVRELHLVERIPSVSSRAADHAYTACQWMPAAASARRDSALAASSSNASPTSSAAAATAVVALASTDGAVRLLDVERNAWVSSAFVGGGCDDGAGEGGLTGLALQDRASLLVTTAAGGLHVVDARCRGSSRSAASSTSGDSVWRTRLSPLDGAPSCACPLYAGDKACAAVVGTYGGAVCLYDLRYQVCAQRVVLMEDWPSRAAAAVAPGPLAITTACVDPLSTLSASCRPPMWEAAPCAGPSMLLGTTTGAVYRLLLESGAYWQAFQCDHARRRRAGGPDAAVRAMLTQPTHGAVFTGGEDGFIRSWSTDKPETSHTLCCVPYVTPPYTVVRTAAAERALAASGASASSLRGLLSVTVREGTTQAACALPRHASDAILSLCSVRTAAAPAAAWLAAGGAGEGEEAAYLLSSSRDGTLTLWDNEPVSRG